MHKVRYWLHSPEKEEEPESHAVKINEICDTYRKAQELEAEGTHVVSTDEMTGVQALEHKYPDKLPIPGMCARMEFEYIRHGTTSLIGFFNVATGSLYPPYMKETRNEEDFLEAVIAIVQKDPLAAWIFVCDGLNIHKSESLVRFVASSCGLDDTDLGEKGKRGIVKDMKSRMEFLHDPSHRIRFVYTPKHSSWMNQIEIWFSILSRKLIKRKSYESVSKLKESIRRFIEQYNLTAHPFKWTYAGVPLTV